MTGRIPFGLLTLLTVLACAPIQGQDQMGAPPAFGAQPNGVQPAGYQLFQEHEGVGEYHGIPLSHQGRPRRGSPGAPPRSLYEELPDDLGFAYDDSPLGSFLTNTISRSWFRSEYLLWNISSPGHVLLGEQTLSGIQTPVSQANSTFATTGVSLGGPSRLSISSGVGYVHSATAVSNAVTSLTNLGGTNTLGVLPGTATTPGLDDISLNNLNGFRGTFGMPLPAGQFEFSAFVLATNSGSFNASSPVYNNVPGSPNTVTVNARADDGNSLIQIQKIPNLSATIGGINQVDLNGLPARNAQNASFISQAALVNGKRSDTTFIDYDISYAAKITTSAWGTEGNYVTDSTDPNSPFQFRPTFGFRYFNFRDRLSQSGQYHESTQTDPTIIVTRRIDTSANNNLFGPQIGTRIELTHSRFVIGVEPKVMLGMNSWKSGLGDVNVFNATDPGQSLSQKGTTFSPLVDVKIYSNIALSKNVSTFVAYNYLWAGNVNRSYNDIQYNKGATGNADFHLLRNYSNAALQGLSFGLELRY